MVLPPLAPPLLATLPAYPSLGESIAYQINGLVVVFVALSSIWATMELIGLFFRRKQPAPAKVPAKAPTPTPAAVPEGPSPEVIAVIVAAVASVLDRPHRIAAISPVELRDWAREGRREIFASHKTR